MDGAIHAHEQGPRGRSALAGLDHELLLVRQGRRTGAHVIIAVHSTVLGPALGGCRVWRYECLDAAAEDALRLAGAMTLKAAAAQLALGGGKAVLFPPPALALEGPGRRALLEDFAEMVNLLDGAYITAEDVGTTTEDMAFLSEHTRHVVGAPARRGGSGDPGAVTARGVEAAMRACCARVFGSADLSGRSVAIVGVGHVGAPLAHSLAGAGAQLLLADIDESKRALARELGAAWSAPAAAMRAEVDVLAPCAMGGVLDEASAHELRARVVCGSANNQLSDDRVATQLAHRGVLYAPDFIANAGGLINVALELGHYDRELALRRVAGIEQLLGEILERAEQAALTPLEAALELARGRVTAAAHDGRLAPGGGDAQRARRAVAHAS